MDAREQFEMEYGELRERLRDFHGQLDSYIVVESESDVKGFTSADVKCAREMRRIACRCLMALDRYDDMAQYYDELEKQQDWLLDLTRKVGKHEEANVA